MRPPLSSGWSSSVFSQSMCTLRRLHPSERARIDLVAQGGRALSLDDDVLRVLTVEEDALPDLEVDQRPEALGVILAGLVSRDELPNDCWLEQVARQRPLAKHEFIDEPTKRRSHPTPHGNGKAHLSALDDLRWQNAAHCRTKDVLCRKAAQLQPVGQCRGKFRERMIEEGHAALDRRRHAHLVLFHQQLMEIGLHIGVEKPDEQRAARHALELRVLYD